MAKIGDGYPSELFKLDMERLGIATKRKPAKVIDIAQYIETIVVLTISTTKLFLAEILDVDYNFHRWTSKPTENYSVSSKRNLQAT